MNRIKLGINFGTEMFGRPENIQMSEIIIILILMDCLTSFRQFFF